MGARAPASTDLDAAWKQGLWTINYWQSMHGNDPNWGRIVSAAGMAGVPFDPDRCSLTLAGTVVFRNGRPAEFDANAVSEAMKSPQVDIVLACRGGRAEATMWTCDLSKEYVTINADYHT